MNTKFNKWFEQAATDPTHRRVAIADLTKQRTILFYCAVAITVCALIICFTPTRNSGAPSFTGFSAVLIWFAFFRVDSNRRALKLIEQFYNKNDAKPTA
jgi:nitrate/nitrite transporter NarK